MASDFQNLDDFLLRARLSKNERRALARLGALNDLPGAEHRRDAMWKAERHLDAEDLFTCARRNRAPEEGELDESKTELHSVSSGRDRWTRTTAPSDNPEPDESAAPPAALQGSENGVQLRSTSPLAAMTPVERLQSDYDTQGLTTGPHPMAYVRKQFDELAQARGGRRKLSLSL